VARAGRQFQSWAKCGPCLRLVPHTSPATEITHFPPLPQNILLRRECENETFSIILEITNLYSLVQQNEQLLIYNNTALCRCISILVYTYSRSRGNRHRCRYLLLSALLTNSTEMGNLTAIYFRTWFNLCYIPDIPKNHTIL